MLYTLQRKDLTRMGKVCYAGLMSNEEMTIKQVGYCAICAESARLSKDLSSSGVVRGLLCLDCKQGLEAFGDSQGLLFAAVKYLQDSKKVDRNHQYFIK